MAALRSRVVNILGLRLGRMSDAALVQLLEGARRSQLTYDHVGSTLQFKGAGGRHVGTHQRDLGDGAIAFAAGVTALRTWVAQHGIGARVFPDGQPVEVGATVLVVLHRGPIRVVALNRIVAVIDEPDRFAFAYGTLPGHPERGEESFMVEHLPDDTVRATIRVDAEPGTIPARATAPLVRRLQLTALHGYLDAIAAHVAKARR